jgi:hypothetical protein
VKDFLAQYADKGHIFPAPGLAVRLRDGTSSDVMMIAPEYSDSKLRIYNDYGNNYWDIKGNAFSSEWRGWILNSKPDYDIVAILDESGAVVAGDAV